MNRISAIVFAIIFLSLFLPDNLLSQSDVVLPANDTLCVPKQLVTIHDWDQDRVLSLDDIRRLYSFGSEYYKNENYKSAIPYLWRVFIHDTTKYARPASRKLAISYFKLNLADSTLIVCYRGLERFPEASTLHHYAGYIQNYKDRYECAIPHYEFLVKFEPKNVFYLEKLAFLYFKVENRKAIDIQRQLVSLYPENSEYHQRLAQYLEHFGEDALEAYKDAFLNDPENLIMATEYSRAAFDVDEFKQAILPLSKMIEFDSANVKALDKRAKCFEGLGDYRSAIQDYKQILSFKSQDIVTMCQIAYNYKDLNEFPKARYWIKRALKIKPGFGLAHLIMGEIYEAAVAYCQDNEKRGRVIDDGFVYRLALEEYENAMDDKTYKIQAKKRMDCVEPLIDTKEERFMADHNKIVEPCYTEWIK